MLRDLISVTLETLEDVKIRTHRGPHGVTLTFTHSSRLIESDGSCKEPFHTPHLLNDCGEDGGRGVESATIT